MPAFQHVNPTWKYIPSGLPLTCTGNLYSNGILAHKGVFLKEVSKTEGWPKENQPSLENVRFTDGDWEVKGNRLYVKGNVYQFDVCFM